MESMILKTELKSTRKAMRRFEFENEPVILPNLYRKSSSAGCVGTTRNRFRITHPFHPLRGEEYELVTRKLNWGEDRVFYYDQTGTLKSFQSNLTDLVPEDGFGRVSAGRSAFRADDLLELRRLLNRHGQSAGNTEEL